MRILALLAIAAVTAPTVARADEVFAGLLAHDVNTPLTYGGYEDGADIQFGWRGDRIEALGFIGKPQPYVFGSLATGGDTSLAAAGLSWKIGKRVYVRPGIGLAIHNRDSLIVGPDGIRRDLGSRILFEPEIGIGFQASDRFSIEASWVHVSHATLFSGQNPGMDSIGVRLNYKLH